MSVRPTFFGLEIAKTGLFVSQKGLDVTGHNVANADTEGYTRQRLVNTAYEPYAGATLLRPVDQAKVGGGAYVMILDQIRDEFLDRQYRTETSTLSYWEARTQSLTDIESLCEGEDAANLTESLNGFFEALNVNTQQAESGAFRSVLLEAAQNLAYNFNIIYENLEQQQLSENKVVETLTEQINNIAEQLADLDKRIYAFELDGQPANDLRDKRNLLVDKLSEIVDVEYGGIAIGDKFWVKIGGTLLVDHTNAAELACDYGTPNTVTNSQLANVATPYWETFTDGTSGSPGADDLQISSGSLKAHIDMRDTASFSSDTPGIPYFMEQLNDLARAIVQEINEQHKKGYTSENAAGGSTLGGNFFEVPTDSLGAEDLSLLTAGSIKVDDAIINDIYKIAASQYKIITDPDDPDYNPGGIDTSNPETTHEGNQVNMIAMYDVIARKNITLSGGATIGGLFDFLDSVVADIATTLNTSKGFEDTRATQRLAVANQRESISGVSLDEEMTNLIKYQHAYGGASRVITAMDEALDTLINKMGLVGR
jgi:flagellar hook-associated protein 1 FlgK